MEFKGGAGIISWPWGGGQGCVFELPVFLTPGVLPPDTLPHPAFEIFAYQTWVGSSGVDMSLPF